MVQRRLFDNILQPIRRQNVMHSKKHKKKKIMQNGTKINLWNCGEWTVLYEGATELHFLIYKA